MVTVVFSTDLPFSHACPVSSRTPTCPSLNTLRPYETRALRAQDGNRLVTGASYMYTIDGHGVQWVARPCRPTFLSLSSADPLLAPHPCVLVSDISDLI